MRDTLHGLFIWGILGCVGAILWLMWALYDAHPAAFTAGLMIWACVSIGLGGRRPRR